MYLSLLRLKENRQLARGGREETEAPVPRGKQQLQVPKLALEGAALFRAHVVLDRGWFNHKAQSPQETGFVSCLWNDFLYI